MIIYINGNATFLGAHFVALTRKISEAKAKITKIDIPLTDGSKDITEATSPIIRYEDRTIIVGVLFKRRRSYFVSDYSEINRKINGKKVTLSFADDYQYQWTGRCSVGPLIDEGPDARVELTFIVKPYKRKVTPSSRETVQVNGETNVTVNCTGMKGSIEFVNVPAGMTVSDGEETYSIVNGKAYGLELKEGQNVLTFNGSGRVLFEVYPEIL